MASSGNEPHPLKPEEDEPEDYYFDGPYLVFTAAYHLKRGFCCQSGCRHCPYGFEKGTSPAAVQDSQKKI